jgi:glyoxylase-like metal-dependent hydrolase (beta-lactamase superfamily II)
MTTKPTIKLPKGMQVFERGWLSSNNILCLDDDSAVLVDSGYLTHANQTLALVQHALNGRPLTTLINTHLHSDHCGGNALLQRTYGCRTLIPVADAAAVTLWDEQVLTFAATGQKCERFTFDDCIKPGDKLSMAGLEWQVMAAPGHDPHSMILYCSTEAILISADALWEHGFGVIFPELVGESGFAEQAAVLKLISELDVRLVIPGHGAPFSDVAGALAMANSRLAYLSADNGKHGRNARNALKALIVFLLLDAQKFSMAEATKQIQDSRIMRAAAQQIGTPITLLVEQLAAELVTSGVAKMHGEWLISSR